MPVETLKKQVAGPLRALIVGRNTDIVQLVCAILKHDNCTCITAPDNDHGYELARVDTPDTIIMLDGKDDDSEPFCRQIREDQQLGDIPLVILTTSSDSNTYERFFSCGCDQVLPVPFRCNQLLEVIDKAAQQQTGKRRSNMIRVLYRSGQTEFVSPVKLNQLLVNKELLCFQRKDGVAMIGRDPLRSFSKADYQGPERRQANA